MSSERSTWATPTAMIVGFPCSRWNCLSQIYLRTSELEGQGDKSLIWALKGGECLQPLAKLQLKLSGGVNMTCYLVVAILQSNKFSRGIALEALENALYNEHLNYVYPNCCILLTVQLWVALRLPTWVCPAVHWVTELPAAFWHVLLWAGGVNWSYAFRFVCIYSNSTHGSLGEPSKYCKHTLVKPKCQSKKCD